MTEATSPVLVHGQPDPRWAAQWTRGPRNRFAKQDLAERLLRWIEYEPNTGCWLWSGGVRKGYGAIGIGGRMQCAHRVSLSVLGGVETSGKVVRHRCDQPACVNPDHLLVGTLRDNTRDMISRGRNRTRRGEAANTAKLTERQARAILASALSNSELAEMHGLNERAVRNLRAGRSWKHLHGSAQ